MWPPSRPERVRARSRWTRVPGRAVDRVVFERVSRETSAVNFPSVFPVTVRQTPDTAMDSPRAISPVGNPAATVTELPDRRGVRDTTVPTSSTIPVNMALPPVPRLGDQQDVFPHPPNGPEGQPHPRLGVRARPSRNGPHPLPQQEGSDQQDVPVDGAFRGEPPRRPPPSLHQQGGHAFGT